MSFNKNSLIKELWSLVKTKTMLRAVSLPNGDIITGNRPYAALLLLQGHTGVITPVCGPSMEPALIDREWTRIVPVSPDQVEIGDALFAIIGQGLCIHRVRDIANSRLGDYLFKTSGEGVFEKYPDGWTHQPIGIASPSKPSPYDFSGRKVY